jgi:hypothetical protein
LSSLLTASLFAIHPIHTEAVTTRHFQTVCIVYKIPILLACADIFFWGVSNGLTASKVANQSTRLLYSFSNGARV